MKPPKLQALESIKKNEDGKKLNFLINATLNLLLFMQVTQIISQQLLVIQKQ